MSVTSPPALLADHHHCDAELLRLSAEFDALDRQAEAFYDRTSPSFIQDDQQRDAALGPLIKAQAETAMRIYPIPALTHEGLIAKLRSFVIYDKEIIKEGGGTPGDLVLASACWDAIGRPARADRLAVRTDPDAELIRLCAQHVVNLHAYNNGDSKPLGTPDPLWDAYVHTRDLIVQTKPGVG